MSSRPRVVIKPRKARPFFARHPWVFVTSIERVENDQPGPVEAGQVVEVVSSEGKFIGVGLINPNSAIRVRMYRWDEGPLDEAFWRSRLESALRLRDAIPGLGAKLPARAVRLVASESDQLSGLIVDRYDRWLVAQFGSLALATRRELLGKLLLELTGAAGIGARVDRATASPEGLKDHPIEPVLAGSMPEGPIEIVENDLRFVIDPQFGQKTGFYCDQRDNRRAAAAWARGRRVLDLYCYTGGFSLNAIKHGGAAECLGVDSSSTAIAFAEQNALLNGIDGATFQEGDVFEVVEALRQEERRFGMIVCDPPKFARSPKTIEDGLKGYLRLNLAAVDLLEPEGILVTCSCSGLVDRGLFAEVLSQVAERSGRAIQILEQRGAAADHPTSASCLESDYLKCFICRVV